MGANIIITFFNIIILYLSFFRTKKMVRELKNDNNKRLYSYRKEYTEWIDSGERYQFPLWLFLLYSLFLFIPPLGLFVYLLTIIIWSVIDFCEDDVNVQIFEFERPKLIFQIILNKKI